MTLGTTVTALSGMTEFAAPLPTRTMHVYRVLDTQTGRLHFIEAPSPEQAAEMVRRAEYYREKANGIGWALGTLLTLALAVLRGGLTGKSS